MERAAGTSRARSASLRVHPPRSVSIAARASRLRRALCCVLLVAPFASRAAGVEDAPCSALRADLDARIERASVGDPRYLRLQASPWLRTTRFLHAELRTSVDAGAATATGTIVDAMAAADAEALARETGRLALGERPDATALRDCRRAAVDALTAPTGRPRLRALAAESLPDGYARWKRILGLYPLARPFLVAGAARWQARARRAIRALPPQAPPGARLDAGVPAPPAWRIARLLAAIRARHPLGWPQPDETETRRLAAWFAPILALPSDATDDRPGRLAGGPRGARVDPDEPVAYVDTELTRWGDRVLLQLRYTFFFTRRPRSGPVDPYGGNVDGIVWRVTLADDGRPLLWDSIHPCGCYHTLFLPAGRGLTYVAGDPGRSESPLLLGGPPPRARVLLRYASGTHYVQALQDHPEPAAAARHYRLLPYADLLAPGPGRPPFRADGILASTQRLERFFLWPSGIRSPGAMRSDGRHAIAFVGRRVFDPARLLDGRLLRRPRAAREPFHSDPSTPAADAADPKSVGAMPRPSP